MAVQICVDFISLVGWTGAQLNIAGFDFSKMGGPTTMPDLLVMTEGGVIGLRFPDAGLTIKLPAPTTKVILKVGRFAQPVGVKLYTSTGVGVASALISATNSYTTKTFNLKKKATRIDLTGGTNEGILARICATF